MRGGVGLTSWGRGRGARRRGADGGWGTGRAGRGRRHRRTPKPAPDLEGGASRDPRCAAAVGDGRPVRSPVVTGLDPVRHCHHDGRPGPACRSFLAWHVSGRRTERRGRHRAIPVPDLRGAPSHVGQPDLRRHQQTDLREGHRATHNRDPRHARARVDARAPGSALQPTETRETRRRVDVRIVGRAQGASLAATTGGEPGRRRNSSP